MKRILAFINRRESPSEFLKNQLMITLIGGGCLGIAMWIAKGYTENQALLGNSVTLTTFIIIGLVLVTALAAICSCISQVRRLHDADKGASLMWILLLVSCIPYVGILGLVGLIYVFRIKGTEGPNRFGDVSTCRYFWQMPKVK